MGLTTGELRRRKMLGNIINRYNKLAIQVKASIWFFICSILQKGISVITTPVFTRIMTTSQYGEFNVFNSWLEIVTVFITLRLYYGVYTQGLVKFEETKDKFASSLQGLTISLISAWLFIYLLLSNFANAILSLSTSEMLAMFLTIWATAVFNFWGTYQRVEYKYKGLVILTIIVSIAKPVLGVIVVLTSSNPVTARIWEIALVEFVAYFPLFVSQMKKGKTFYDRQIWKYALAFNIPLIPHYLSQVVLNSSDRIMIQQMTNSDFAGIYSLAYSVASVMNLVNTALLQTISPWIYQKLKSNKANEIKNVAYPSLIIIGAANLALILFAPEIIRLFAPPEYYNAIWAIPPVALSSFFIFAYSMFANIEFYYEKPGFIAISTTVAAVANVVLNYIGIRLFGWIAAAYTTLICYIIYASMHFIFMERINKTEIKYTMIYSRKILLIMSAIFVAIGLTLMLTYNWLVLRYCVIVLGLIICFVYRKQIIRFVRENMSRSSLNVRQ